MNILFLDDNGTRQKWFKSELPSAICVWNSGEAIVELGNLNIEWDYVFLDHDLGDEVYVDSTRKDTGAEVARYIAAQQPKIGLVVIHSFNHDGAKEMLHTLRTAKYYTSRAMFGSELFKDIIKNIQTKN